MPFNDDESYDTDCELTDELCPECGSPMLWADCWNGCDDGYFDGYDEDPLWYDEGDLIPCSNCNGRGGFYICTNSKSHASNNRVNTDRANAPSAAGYAES